MAKNPYAVKLTEEERGDLTVRLVEDLRAGMRARSAYMDDLGLIDFAYALYEQQALKPTSHGSAARNGDPDLTSPIGTENVDALSARAVQTLFRQEPVFMVDGDAASAHKAPAVEVYMQMRVEQTRFQQVAKRAVQASLVQTGAVLEVCEDAEPIRRHEVVHAKILRAPDGSLVLDGKTGKPVAATDARGRPIPADVDDPGGSVETHHTWTEWKRAGAYPRVRSMKDFLFLPAHAADDREIYAHATRFYPRRDEVKRYFDRGDWGPKAGGCTWDEIQGVHQEREQRDEQDRRAITVEHSNHHHDSTEMELWRVQAWLEIPGQDGLCLVHAVVSERHEKVLALLYDWIGAFRTVYINPYPCDYSAWGYSMVLTKLISTIEEHTAWRNMNAKRGTLKSNAPLKRRSGARWDPLVQPFSPDIVIDLDNMDDVQIFEFEDVTAQAVTKEQQSVVDAQRIVGLNDIAIGQVSEKSRTLGENKMATSASFVRTDDPISNIQEALEEVGWLMHRIEVQSLKMGGRTVPAPDKYADQLIQRGEEFDGEFTWEMLDGDFTFKPRGSSDQSDPVMRMRKLDARIGLMERVGKYNMHVQQRLASPEFADSLMRDLVSETKPRDTSPYLKALPAPMFPGMPGMSPPGMSPGGPGGVPMPGPPGGRPGGQRALPPAAPNFGGAVLNQLMAQLPSGGA